MLKIGIIIAIPLVVGFITFGQLRTTIIALAPFALYAICPLGMIFCMKAMNKQNCSINKNPDGNKCNSCDSQKN